MCLKGQWPHRNASKGPAHVSAAADKGKSQLELLVVLLAELVPQVSYRIDCNYLVDVCLTFSD